MEHYLSVSQNTMTNYFDSPAMTELAGHDGF